MRKNVRILFLIGIDFVINQPLFFKRKLQDEKLCSKLVRIL